MDSQPKLYLNMILKEDEPAELVKRSIDSVKDYVDGMYIAITYKETQPSEDSQLVQLLKFYGANILYFKWIYDFAQARQYVLDATPKGPFSFIYWQDADDVLQNAFQLKDVLNFAVQNQIAAVFLKYWYQVDTDAEGNITEVVIEHKRERVVRNDDTFKWVGMLHETLIEQRSENVLKAQEKAFNDCIVIHFTSQERIQGNLDRNLEILENQARIENHRDPRTVIYLAKAYFDKAKLNLQDDNHRKVFFDLALALFTEYLNGEGDPGSPGYHEGSGWPEERSTAWSYIAEIARMSGQLNVAVKALHNAMIEAPQFPNYYVDLAMIHAMKGELAKAKQWLSVGVNTPMPDTTIITTPRDLKARALEVDYNIALNEGRLDDAEEDARKLCEVMPDNEELKNRLISINSTKIANKVCQSIVYIGKYLEDIKEPEKIIPLIQAIPRDLQQEKFASEMRHKFLPPKIWKGNEIAILCGPTFEVWTPNSIETGLGGSEEAVVYLAKELAQLGWKVTVYANPGQEAGDFDGVTYKMWFDLNQKDFFNVLVMWRGIGFVDLNPKARFKLLWLHDVPSNPDFTEERINKIDKIAVLSEYHRSLLRMFKDGEYIEVPEDKVIVTGNGIPSFELDPEIKRDPHKLIYASSPDRGLIYLLNNWKTIKEQVPEATLDVYYGFQIWDAIHANNPARMAFKNHLLDLMKQDGITYHGRIGHKDLMNAYAQAAVWAYPTDFQEISCISAMKAQACGAIPVTTDFAALKETVKNGQRLDVDITTKEGQEEYVKTLVELLKDPQKQEEIRTGMTGWAKEYFHWSKVATDWNSLFRATVKFPEEQKNVE